jgi:hypothetical protein
VASAIAPALDATQIVEQDRRQRLGKEKQTETQTSILMSVLVNGSNDLSLKCSKLVHLLPDGGRVHH